MNGCIASCPKIRWISSSAIAVDPTCTAMVSALTRLFCMIRRRIPRGQGSVLMSLEGVDLGTARSAHTSMITGASESLRSGTIGTMSLMHASTTNDP